MDTRAADEECITSGSQEICCQPQQQLPICNHLHRHQQQHSIQQNHQRRSNPTHRSVSQQHSRMYSHQDDDDDDDRHDHSSSPHHGATTDNRQQAAGRRKPIIFNHNVNRCRCDINNDDDDAVAGRRTITPSPHRFGSTLATWWTTTLMAVVVVAVTLILAESVPVVHGAIASNGGNGAGKEPTFRTRSESFKFKYNDTITLPCDVTNADAYMVAWKRGIAILTAGQVKVSPDPRIRLVNGYTLQISNAMPQDAGDYICQIAMLHPREITHMVEILIPPKFTRSPPAKIHSKKGETVNVECMATGNPIPTVTWTRKNNLLLPNGETTMLGSTLTIDYMDPNKGGIYICTANNGVGMPVSAVAEVMVMYAPEIIVEEPVVHTREGLEAELTCIVNGNADPTVQWFRSTMQLDTTERHTNNRHGSRNTLLIRNVQRSDFTNYTCVAENALGKARRIVTLTGLPTAAVVRSNGLSPYKDRYNLTWTVQSGQPVLETRIAYRRLQNGGSGGDMSHHGGGGHHGGAVHDTELIENDLMSMNPYNMYKAAGGHRPKHEWLDVMLTNERRAQDQEQWMWYMMRDLEPDTGYEVNITQKNVYGWGNHATHFTFKTAFTDSYFETSDQGSLTGSAFSVLGVTNYDSSAAHRPTTTSTSLLCCLVMAMLIMSSRLGLQQQQRA